MPERIPLPRSSSLVAVTYDEFTATLDVEFRHGETYRYFLVPRSVVHRLIEAESAGKFGSPDSRVGGVGVGEPVPAG